MDGFTNNYNNFDTTRSMRSVAESLRNKTLSINECSVKLALLSNTDQTTDIGRPITLNGYGRIHCFSELPQNHWINDPLPTIPAARTLKCSTEETRDAQILQLAACNLRCWYCFVDYESLSPSTHSAKDFKISDLVYSIVSNQTAPRVLDLSGGNPGLVPEWILWTIRALKELDNHLLYLWADDNLTVDFYSQYLSINEIEEIANYPRFGSVGCFKGFDEESFAFNTGLSENLFQIQFDTFRSLFSFGWDIYGYVTFTTPNSQLLVSRIASFVDRLQEIDTNLPLRVIPLEIKPYTPTKQRMTKQHEQAIHVQYDVLNCWTQEIKNRFSKELRCKEICDIPYATRSSL